MTADDVEPLARGGRGLAKASGGRHPHRPNAVDGQKPVRSLQTGSGRSISGDVPDVVELEAAVSGEFDRIGFAYFN